MSRTRMTLAVSSGGCPKRSKTVCLWRSGAIAAACDELWNCLSFAGTFPLPTGAQSYSVDLWTIRLCVSERQSPPCIVTHREVWGVAVSVSEGFRAKAREYAVKAQSAKDHEQWQSMKGFAKSYLLLEKSEKWLSSTDRFLEALKANQRWPGPAEEEFDG